MSQRQRPAVLVTGASRGIGAAMARHFLAEDRVVTGIDISPATAGLAAMESHAHQIADIIDESRLKQAYGNIVFITSSLAKLGWAVSSDVPYFTSKRVVEMFSKVLSLELASAGVNVNTPAVKIDAGFLAHLPESERRRMARPDILSRCASFLADLRPRALTDQSSGQERFDADKAYRRSLGAPA